MCWVKTWSRRWRRRGRRRRRRANWEVWRRREPRAGAGCTGEAGYVPVAFIAGTIGVGAGGVRHPEHSDTAALPVHVRHAIILVAGGTAAVLAELGVQPNVRQILQFTCVFMQLEGPDSRVGGNVRLTLHAEKATRTDEREPVENETTPGSTPFATANSQHTVERAWRLTPFGGRSLV